MPASRVAEGDRPRMRICCVVRDAQEKREGYQALPLEQIDIEQSREALRVDEKHARARFARKDGTLECESVEVVVDACVRFPRERRVHGPRDFERREVVGVRSGPQQPQGLRCLVLEFDPYRLHAGLVDVGAEHAPAVLGAQHRRRHARALPGGSHGACAQLCVVESAGSLPCRTAGDNKQEARRIQRVSEQTQQPTQDRAARC